MVEIVTEHKSKHIIENINIRSLMKKLYNFLSGFNFFKNTQSNLANINMVSRTLKISRFSLLDGDIKNMWEIRVEVPAKITRLSFKGVWKLSPATIANIQQVISKIFEDPCIFIIIF
jgi:hypothetical protein